jgi:hypothetical protein
MALAQLFYLREAIRRRARSLRHRWASRPVPHNRSFTLEPLEGRLLLSADLTGIVTAHTLLDPSVPTNAEAATIRVLNQGSTATNQVSQVAVYASLDNILDAGDVLLGNANAPNPHYSRLMVRGAVAAMLERPATPMPLSRSLTAAAGPYVLCWEWSGGRRTS